MSAGLGADADASALADCGAWVSSLQALVMEVDMHVASLRMRLSHAGTAVSQDWPDLARHTVLQMRNIEHILQVWTRPSQTSCPPSFTPKLHPLHGTVHCCSPQGSKRAA